MRSLWVGYDECVSDGVAGGESAFGICARSMSVRECCGVLVVVDGVLVVVAMQRCDGVTRASRSSRVCGRVSGNG